MYSLVGIDIKSIIERMEKKATKQSRMWHMHILSLRGAAQSITLIMLSRKRRSNLGCGM
jgi:hypothetical protein